MFSRFLDYIRNNDDDDNNNHNNTNKNNKQQQNSNNSNNAQMIDSSSSTTSSSSDTGKKRRVKEDYRVKYAYLDYVSTIDIRGIECLAEDVRGSVEILKNSYLAIVNSLVILNERRRKRRQQQFGSVGQMPSQDNSVQVASSTFLNSKVAHNFRNSDQDYLSSYPDTYVWTIDKFCDPATREIEFQHLFKESENYVDGIDRIKSHLDPINMAKFTALVRQGKNLLGIIELLNNNYSNNFLDIFRLS